MATHQPRKPALTISDQLALLAARGLPLPPIDAHRMTHLLSDRSFSAVVDGDGGAVDGVGV